MHRVEAATAATYWKDDCALVGGVLRSDPEAERHFIARYGRYIHGFAKRHGLSGADADDLCQDVLVRLWEDDKRRIRLWYARRKHAPRGAVSHPGAAVYDGDTTAAAADGGRFTAFLSVVVAHLLCDHRRASAVAARHLVSSAADSVLAVAASAARLLPERVLLERVQAAAVREALLAMGPRDAALLSRRHLRGESYREIAAGMGMTVNHVGVALGRAERRLRDRLASALASCENP